jgi:hypothetical protein
MGDSVSIPTNVAQSDTISRIQQSAKTDEQAEEKFAKKLREKSDHDEVGIKNIAEAERVRMKKQRRDQESRKRREQAREKARKQTATDGRGGHIDLKV